VSHQVIRVTARPRANGIDIERLALVLLELAEQLPERKSKTVRAKREKPSADSKSGAQSNKKAWPA